MTDAPSDKSPQDSSPPSPEAEELRREKVHDIHEAILADGEEELDRPTSALAWSGLAAGMSMSFSLIAEGLLKHHLPDANWSPAVAKLGYCFGFLVVVLGRQQLFTENTLTVVIPILHHKTAAAFLNLLRVWAVVLAANLLGGLVVAWVLAHTNSFEPPVREAFLQIGRKALEPDALTVLLRGVYAGWLIALLVWLLPASGPAKLGVIVALTYLVGLGQFSHVIAGAIEVFYVAAAGHAGWWHVVSGFVLPALAGNILGGVLLTATLNHAQVVAGE